MHDPPADALPPPTDPPFLMAILVGAIRTGDDMLRELAEEWLAALGVRVTFDPDSPVVRPCRGGDGPAADPDARGTRPQLPRGGVNAAPDPPAAAAPEEFVRVKDIARITKVSYHSLLRRHRDGHDVGLRKFGRVVLFHTPTLAGYLRSAGQMDAS